MARKNIIWCEVTCRYCGALASASGYYSADTIRKLKEDTKDWVEDEEYLVLCPECKKELGR